MIRVKGLYKSFNGNPVLNGIDLTVERGKTFVLLGASGSGKSVFLRNVIGLTRPDKGSVYINDIEITALSSKEKLKRLTNVGMSFQAAALFDSLTIEENVAFHLMEHLKKTGSYSISDIRDLVNDALKRVGLEDTNKKMPAELSGGMRKRAALARLIVYRPEYLFYDEPTAGLDPMTSARINELIVEIQNDLKATSVVVTHDPSTALYVSDSIALIEKGKILHQADPESFMQTHHPTVEFLNRITGNSYKTLIRRK